jgi:hypothetical protein
MEWDSDREVNEITLFADSDFDHPMESVQWGHFDNRMPFCVDEISVFNEKNELLAQKTNNHQTRISFKFEEKICIKKLTIKLSNSSENVPVSLFGIHIK